MKSVESLNINHPINQLNIFGYEDYFNSFIKLYEKKMLPNVMLLNGPKGIGKATFVYHFINYLFSKNEEAKYSTEYYEINPENASFNHIKNNTHPNFFLLDKNDKENEIKIEKTRSLIKFLSKSTLSKNIKIVLIDNLEFLNLNSSNAILKILEEPPENTFFFIVNDSSNKIIKTIKSRCIEFNFNFDINEKINIFNHLAVDLKLNINQLNLNDFLYFYSPGNLLKYLLLLKDFNSDLSKDTLNAVLYLIDLYKTNKDPEILYFVIVSIEKFYYELVQKNIKNINSYFVNKYKILNLIDNMKKFNLDKKNLFFTVNNILINEK